MQISVVATTELVAVGYAVLLTGHLHLSLEKPKEALDAVVECSDFITSRHSPQVDGRKIDLGDHSPMLPSRTCQSPCDRTQPTKMLRKKLIEQTTAAGFAITVTAGERAVVFCRASGALEQLTY